MSTKTPKEKIATSSSPPWNQGIFLHSPVRPRFSNTASMQVVHASNTGFPTIIHAPPALQRSKSASGSPVLMTQLCWVSTCMFCQSHHLHEFVQTPDHRTIAALFTLMFQALALCLSTRTYAEVCLPQVLELCSFHAFLCCRLMWVYSHTHMFSPFTMNTPTSWTQHQEESVQQQLPLQEKQRLGELNSLHYIGLQQPCYYCRRSVGHCVLLKYSLQHFTLILATTLAPIRDSGSLHWNITFGDSSSKVYTSGQDSKKTQKLSKYVYSKENSAFPVTIHQDMDPLTTKN